MAQNIDTCVILCGGASKRIKTKNAESKIFLPFGGASLVAYQFKKMQEIFPKVFISCKENQRENIKKSLVDFAINLAGDSAENEKNADSANFDFTHPLTPSAREGEQKAKTSAREGESNLSLIDSADSQNLNDIFILENGDIFAPIFGIYNALNHLFDAESTAESSTKFAESTAKISDSANFDFTHPLRHPSAREGEQRAKTSAMEGEQKANPADSAKIAESPTNPADSADSQNLIAESKKAFFISCDSPLIRAKTIDILCKNSKDYEITCARDSLNVHYLVGVWSASLAQILRQMIEKGDFKLQNIPTHIKSIFFDRAEFLNINTASDYKVALKALGA
ncbi:NTP transferase domain-containing protein [Helicobacter sp. 23-1044]